MTTAILGIDPGFTGAIAVTDGTQLLVHDMPLRKHGGKNEVHPMGLKKIVAEAHRTLPLRGCVVEDVHAFPEQGLGSTFRFGYGAGVVRGVVECLGFELWRVRPEVWKCALGLRRDKAHARELAARLYPKHKKLFARAKDDGRAEAVLIAHFFYSNL